MLLPKKMEKISRGKKDPTTFSRQACFVNRFTSFQPLKSEAIPETGFFPLKIFIPLCFNVLSTVPRETLVSTVELTVNISYRPSLELTDISTTTTTTKKKSTRMNLDELYLPNRCYDQGFWQEVDLEI